MIIDYSNLQLRYAVTAAVRMFLHLVYIFSFFFASFVKANCVFPCSPKTSKTKTSKPKTSNPKTSKMCLKQKHLKPKTSKTQNI